MLPDRPRPVHEHADAPHPLALLRPCRERPRGRSAAEQRDELAPLSLDHLVGAGKHRRRESYANPVSSALVYDQFKSSRLLDWQFPRGCPM